MGSVFLLSVILTTQVQATIDGTVRDATTDKPISGAFVSLTDLDRVVTTDTQGRYSLPAVPPGPQHLAVRFIGYDQRTIHALVPGNGRLEINISLQPRPVLLEAVNVRSAPAIRGVEGDSGDAFPDRWMSIAAVRHHPMLSEPDAFQAIGGGAVFLRPESPSGIHIRGGASDQTAYLLDGIPVFSPYHVGGVFGAWNPDALSGIGVSSALPTPAAPDALSGTIEALTLAPGSRFRARGHVSTTQASVTADGPLGGTGAGYLVSVRKGLPNLVAPRNEPAYPEGENGDWLAKIETPLLGGSVRMLGYVNTNEIEAAAVAELPDTTRGSVRRNVFEWHSRSFGAAWSRLFSSVRLQIHGWHAASDAGADWTTPNAIENLAATRRDNGFLAAVEHRSGTATTVAGFRFEHISTSYRLGSDSAVSRASTDAPITVGAAFIQREHALTRSVDLNLGLSVTAAVRDLYVGPRARLRWRAVQPLTFSVSYSRTHQFAQSLRNPESVVGNIFPADLFVAASAPGVPVARSDLGIVAAEFRPISGVRLGVQGFQRDFNGLVLVAPRDVEPFTTGTFAVGSGNARGVAFDVAARTARYGFVASYGWQRVRFDHGGSSYVPEHGASHAFESGVIVFPSATASVRLGVSGAIGRRATTVTGGLEFEGCSLLGCEFGGSPRYTSEDLAVATLPGYLRVDVGVRKHWHLRIAGRDASVGIFGTLSNVFGRTNLLTYARDPLTDELVGIDMRPLSPLVVGLDWRF